MTNAPTLKIHIYYLKRAFGFLLLLSLFSCASLNLSETRYNLQGKILFKENNVQKDLRMKLSVENNKLKIQLFDILGTALLAEINSLGNKWKYENFLIDINVDFTPNELRAFLKKNSCSRRCNIDGTIGNIRILLQNV
tara:strand:- start:28 stop:441 length:414 start_codon:yes stop_codon:yes gene_type:complete